MRISCQSDTGSSGRISAAGPVRPDGDFSRAVGARSLLVAIHDVVPSTIAEVRFLRARLARHVPPERIAMLVIPDRWGEAPIRPRSSFARRLRGWSDQGVEMFVHGWYHRDDSSHRSAGSRFKARYLTAGEGEFLGLSRKEAARRMADGRALIEDICGRPVAGFVAPAWLYGPGALAAAADLDFTLCEDHFRVWKPRGNEVLCRGPVICWASRSPARIDASRAAALALRHFLGRAPVVRVAVHPGDAHIASLLTSIDLTLRSLASRRRAIRYGDLESVAGKARP